MTKIINTLGIDVGGSYVKGVLLKYSASGDNHTIVDKKSEKIRKRNPVNVAAELINYLLEKNTLNHEQDIAYLASTGEGEMVLKKKGHFYSMTTHAKGGVFFKPDARIVVDLGGLYIRAIRINELGRVLNYKMTGQCASGSGQFIENISRYLGLAVEEVGDLSLQADKPETPSGICAVLAETDVINSVSKGFSTANIVKGIHLSIATRIIKLLRSLKADKKIVLVGGMAMNKGIVQAIEELSAENKYDFEIVTHPDAIFSGALGAAIWGGFRYFKLQEKSE